jgi:FkbM family methyltransferase
MRALWDLRAPTHETARRVLNSFVREDTPPGSGEGLQDKKRVARLWLKRTCPWLPPLVVRGYAFAGVVQDILDECFYWASLRRGVSRNIRPRIPLRVHPTAWRRSFFAFAPGGFCADEMSAFLAVCHPGMKLIDVGSGFGVFSFAALTFPESVVVAVDPAPAAVRMLLRLKKMNGISDDRLRILEMAVSSADCEVVAMDARLACCYAKAARGATRTHLVPSRTLDQIAGAAGLIPTHIKVDVEGAELDVLEGARRLLTDVKPVLQIEIHNAFLTRDGKDPRQVHRLLEQAGYTLQWFSVERAGSAPLVTRTLWIHSSQVDFELKRLNFPGG